MITNDGGETWTKINYNFGASLHSVEFFGSGGIALSASDGKFLFQRIMVIPGKKKLLPFQIIISQVLLLKIR